MTTHAAIYLRVSTEDQAERYGLDAQREQCEAMATVKGWKISCIFQDDGISGTKLPDERPGLRDLLEAVEQGEIDAIIVVALDRLGRLTRIVLDVVEQIQAAGAALVSCKENFDTSTPAGQFVMTMFAALAQLERDNIVARTTAGRNARGRQDGERGGRVPMGYERELEKGKATGLVFINQFESAIVRRIFARRRAGATLTAIADELNADGVKTRRGGAWHASSVRAVLQNGKKYRGGQRGASELRWPAILK